jgi:tRNA U34 5-carboxymethylaminomethyl modifying GTPase MnmE/TrmE
VEDFSTIRGRVNPAWQEEFVCMKTSNTNEPVPIREPNWMIYDDAWKWSHHLKDAVEELRKSLSSFAQSHENSHQQISIISERMAKILENTQHVDHADLAVPKTLEGLVTPHMALVHLEFLYGILG